MLVMISMMSCKQSKPTQPQNTLRYSLSNAHEYVLNKYFENASVPDIVKVIESNIDLISTDGELDETKFQDFFLSNTRLFYDEAAMERSVDQASNIYDFDASRAIPLFSEEFNNLYFDISHEHGGVNLFKISKLDRKNELLKLVENMEKTMTPQEYLKIVEYLDFYTDEKQDFNEIRHFCNNILNDTDSDYTEDFRNVMIFTIRNTYYLPPTDDNIRLSWVGKFLDTVTMFMALNHTKCECYECTPYGGGMWDHDQHWNYALSESGKTSYLGGLIDIALDVATDSLN